LSTFANTTIITVLAQNFSDKTYPHPDSWYRSKTLRRRGEQEDDIMRRGWQLFTRIWSTFTVWTC